MSERKYLVPEGMLRAAWHAQLPADNPTFEWDEGDEMNRKFYRRIFEAALRWLSDNPRPMNISLARELDKEDTALSNSRASDIFIGLGLSLSQRRAASKIRR